MGLPLVDRVTEMDAVRGALSRAERGEGSLLLLRGEAGIGKTRLVEEAVAAARGRGFDAGHGTALSESGTLYHPWSEALRELGLAHLLHGEVQPRLLGLYLLGGGGLPAAKAERPGLTGDPEIFAAMSNAVADFLRAGLAHLSGNAEGNLLRFAHGDRCICVLRGDGFALVAVLQGKENELFVREMQRLAVDIEERDGGRLRAWDGCALDGLDAPLRALIVSGRYDGVDLAADGQARKLNLFDNVLFGLRRRAALRPLMVVIDDLQWADPSSLGLLHYLARNTRKDRVLLIGAYRAEETGVRPHLHDALRGMSREELGTDIPVSPLSPGDTRALAGHLLGRSDLPGQFYDLLAGETEGNPLFVREVVRALREEGALVTDPATGGVRLVRQFEHLHVPSKIRDVVERRLSRISEDERALLDTAAVCGTQFDGALVAGVMGESEARVLRGLNAVSRVHALVRTDGMGWRFEHTVIREVLYGALSEDLKRLYHRTAADVLEGRGGAPDAVGLHYAAARDGRAVVCLRAVASGAMERGAPEEAAGFLRSALELAAPGERSGLEVHMAEALDLAGQPEEALAAVGRAAEAGAPPARCALLRIGVLERQSAWEAALCAADEALPKTEGVEAARLRERKAFVLMRLSRLAEAEREAAEALKLFPEEEKRGRGDATNTLGTCHYCQGRFEPALALFTEALRLREEAGDRRGVAGSLNNIGSVHHEHGDLVPALEYYSRSLAVSEAIGYRYLVAVTLNSIGQIHYERGDLGPALEHSMRSLAIRESIGDRYGIGYAHSIIGMVLARTGDAAGALDHLGSAMTVFKEVGEKRTRAEALANSVMPRIALGQVEAAGADAEEALRLSREAGMRREEAMALRAAAEVRAALGSMDEARRLFGEAVKHYNAMGAAVEAAETKRRWGVAAVAAGLAGEADGQLKASVELFESLKLPKRAEEARGDLRRLPIPFT